MSAPLSRTARPRLLFLSQRIPFPPDSGAASRTFNVIRQLARAYDVHAVCFGGDDAGARAAGLRPWATVEVFPVPQHGSRLRLAADHARSLLTGRPYTWYMFDHGAAERRIAGLARDGGFALAHVDSLDLLRFFPLLGGLPVACTHHSVESQLLRRRAASERSPLRRWYLQLQGALVERAERRWLPRLALNVAVSELEAVEFRRLIPAARTVAVPNAVDTEFFTPHEPAVPEGARVGLVSVGGTSWHPNRDGLAWFVDEVLPRLRARGVDAPVTWVGRVTDAERARWGGVPGLTLTGHVDDIRPYVRRARVFIAPLRVGGGTRIKLLDAWAMGMAIVATPLAAEGLAVEPDGNMVLTREGDADDFAAGIARVLADDVLRRRLETGARRTAVERYGWDAVGGEMLAAYREIERSG